MFQHFKRSKEKEFIYTNPNPLPNHPNPPYPQTQEAPYTYDPSYNQLDTQQQQQQVPLTTANPAPDNSITLDNATIKDSLYLVSESSDDSFDKENKPKVLQDQNAALDEPIFSQQPYLNNPGSLQFLKLVFRKCSGFTETQLKNLAGKSKDARPAARYIRLQFIKSMFLSDGDLTHLGGVLGSLGNIEYLSLEIKASKGNMKLTQQGVFQFLSGILAGGNNLKYLRIKVRKCRNINEKEAESLRAGIMGQCPNLQELVLSFNKKAKGEFIRSWLGKVGDDNMEKVMDMAHHKVESLGLGQGQMYKETTVVYFNRVFSNKVDNNGVPVSLEGRQGN